MATLVHAWYFEGVWRANVSNQAFCGFGTGSSAQAAIDAAMADFTRLQPAGPAS